MRIRLHGVVDHRVPLPALERLQVAVAIADELLDVREERGIGLAAIEQRDRVAAVERVLDLIRADEAGAAEDENAKWAGGLLARRRGELDAVRRPYLCRMGAAVGGDAKSYCSAGHGGGTQEVAPGGHVGVTPQHHIPLIVRPS